MERYLSTTMNNNNLFLDGMIFFTKVKVNCLSFSLYSFQETSACRDLLLGSNTRQFKKFPFPHHGVFNEKSKTNLFSVRQFIP